ncbi:MAG: 8-oxo-dGTP diphosphatase [Lachnospiraceae bacterium]|nr:8-oxo-dGTP diphosphatase [Lachnospiraceae bacterium]
MGHHTEKVELTVLCMIQDGNKVLLQNRIKEDWKGYTFPGGHVEAGESFVDAVVREMKEETGLEILDPRLVGIKQFPIENGRYIVLLFKATKFRGDVVSSEEGEMEWIELENLSKVNVVEDFFDLMKVLNDPSINEFQYTIEGDEWIVHLK